MLPAHPPFQLIPYRTPAGTRNEGDLGFLTDDNTINQGFISEMLMCTVHSGTHIDAIAHCVCGPRNLWYGGDSADQYLGDFGPMKKDASELPPVITRGVMIDIPALLGVPHLRASQPIHREDLEAALKRQGTEIHSGDVVLIRTGIMSHWPNEERLAACAGAGLAIDGAEWLTKQGVSMVGADNVALEVTPTTVLGVPLPVHRHLIHENGIPIIEWVFLEDLARDKVYDFLFLCLPLPISGATGSMIRPLAVV
jgi:kynurenine formamidase